jgi:hypothetical protein
LKLLQLGPVPGSTIGAAQDLTLTVPPPSDFQLAIAGGEVVVRFSMRTNVLYDIQSLADLRSCASSNATTDLSGMNGSITHVVVGAVSDPPRLYRLDCISEAAARNRLRGRNRTPCARGNGPPQGGLPA